LRTAIPFALAKPAGVGDRSEGQAQAIAAINVILRGRGSRALRCAVFVHPDAALHIR